MSIVSSAPDTDIVVRESSSVLVAAEERLLAFIRQSAQEGVSLDEVLSGIDQLAAGARPQFRRLNETLARRDLPFEAVGRLEALRRHWLWLYRKIRLEHIFFTKLKIERQLRDTLYRQVAESTHQLSSLDEQERALQVMDEDRLARELLDDPHSADTESVGAPWR